MDNSEESPLEGLPENMPLYKDSGRWQLRSDDMEEVVLQQGVNESDIKFLKRCKDMGSMLLIDAHEPD